MSRGRPVTAARREPPPGAVFKLTAAEAAVVAEAARGLRNTEIARRLRLPESTVKSRLAAVYRKLGLRRRLQLIALFRP